MRGLDTQAGTVLLLSPDWTRPLTWLPRLSAYIVGAPADGDTCLALDARATPLAPAFVGRLVERACEYLSEGLPFAEVLLVVGEADASGAEAVTSAAEIVDRLDLRIAPLRDDPVEIINHARWAKSLADDLQSQIDRALFEAAPPVDLVGEPLVTVRIPTFGSVDLLVQRAIPSVLQGNYQNFELLVCSDGPQPHAREAVAGIADPRVRYIEVPKRPSYPEYPMAFWRVAGTSAVNRLVEESRGALIAPLDHDDAFTVDHIQVLLDTLRRNRADWAYGMAMTEWQSGAWSLLGQTPMVEGAVVHATVMYTRRLAHMRYDPHAWLQDEPGDWNLWQRIRDLGTTTAFAAWPVAVHFKERTSIEGRAPTASAIDTIAEDVRKGAPELLGVASRVRGAAGLDIGRAPAPPARPAGKGARRLAVLDTDFPLVRSGFRYHEAAEILRRRPDTVFFSANRTRERWPRPVYPLSQFGRLAGPLGITDAYSVFLNFTVSLLGLQHHPGTATCAGIPPDHGVAKGLASNRIRLHTTMYPGGGLVTDTDPALMRAVAAKSATVFTNTAEAVAAVNGAIRIAGPMAVDFYAYRPRARARGDRFRFVFAADHRPRKGLDTALEALAQLDARFHLHVVGPHETFVRGIPSSRLTYHGFLAPAQLRDVYWQCDAFVSPVRPEGPDGMRGEVGLVDGFPTTTACEALASGCALVSSNPREEHWIVEPEKHFIQFPMRDSTALAEALQRLEADRPFRDAIAERGATRIREVMDVRRVVDAKLEAMGLDPDAT